MAKYVRAFAAQAWEPEFRYPELSSDQEPTCNLNARM